MKCLICEFVGKSLGKHLSAAHSLTSLEYLTKYPGSLVKCEITRKRYSEQNRDNGNWITRAKDNGDDLVEYRAKMGKAVSEAIMTNPDERARRSQQMAANNRTEEAKEKSRNTAKKTSARPEILAQRTANLAKWREANFEEFYEKCLVVMHNTWVSKPELALFEIVSKHQAYSFARNQCVKSEIFSSRSRRKQVDIGDRTRRVYIEFDGILHFKPVRGDDVLANVQKKDNELDEHILRHQWTLIRVSYSLWKNDFSALCLEKLFQLLNDPQPGVWCLGVEYNDRNILTETDTLAKSQS